MGKKLAGELRRIRRLRDFSLREVERRTKISNAYLSQLERGEAENPSPHILSKLSEIYDYPYELLMESAGYFHDKKGGSPKKKMNALQMALMSATLTPDEEEKIAEFIEFLKFEKKQGKT